LQRNIDFAARVTVTQTVFFAVCYGLHLGCYAP